MPYSHSINSFFFIPPITPHMSRVCSLRLGKFPLTPLDISSRIRRIHRIRHPLMNHLCLLNLNLHIMCTTPFVGIFVRMEMPIAECRTTSRLRLWSFSTSPGLLTNRIDAYIYESLGWKEYCC